MDKTKQKQTQKQYVVINVAHPKLRRKTKRRVKAPPQKRASFLDSSFMHQPLTRMIRYDVPIPVAQPSPVLASGISQPPVVTANKLIVDTPIEKLGVSPATEDNLGAASAGEAENPLTGKKKGRPPGSKNKPKIIAYPLTDFSNDVGFGAVRSSGSSSIMGPPRPILPGQGDSESEAEFSQRLKSRNPNQDYFSKKKGP